MSHRPIAIETRQTPTHTKKVNALQEVRDATNLCSWDPAESVLNTILLHIDALINEGECPDGALPQNLRDAMEVYVQAKRKNTIATPFPPDEDSAEPDAGTVVSDSDIYEVLAELNKCLSGPAQEKIRQYLPVEFHESRSVPKALVSIDLSKIPADVTFCQHLTLTANVLFAVTCWERYDACERYFRECYKKQNLNFHHPLPLPGKSSEAPALKLVAKSIADRESRACFTDCFNLQEGLAKTILHNRSGDLRQAGSHVYQYIVRQLKLGALENIEAAIKFAVDEKIRLISNDSSRAAAFSQLAQRIARDYPTTSMIDYNRYTGWWGNNRIACDIKIEVGYICDGFLTQDHISKISELSCFHQALRTTFIRKRLFRNELKMEDLLGTTRDGVSATQQNWLEELTNKRIVTTERILSINFREYSALSKAVLRQYLLSDWADIEQIFNLANKNVEIVHCLDGESLNDLVCDGGPKITIEQMIGATSDDIALIEKYRQLGWSAFEILTASRPVKLALGISEVFNCLNSGQLTKQTVLQNTTDSGVNIIMRHVHLPNHNQNLKPYIKNNTISIELILSATLWEQTVLARDGTEAFVKALVKRKESSCVIS